MDILAKITGDWFVEIIPDLRGSSKSGNYQYFSKWMFPFVCP